MTSSLHIARSGLEALDARLRTIANNLANVNTVGFKRDRAAFETLLYQSDRPSGALAGADRRFGMGLATGAGVRIAGTERIHAQGAFQITNNALDLAIDGEGLFQVELPDGTLAYTRAGAFTRDGEGRLVTPQGHRLVPEIQIPANATGITVAPDGTVSAQLPGTVEPTELGRLQLATFINPAGLEPMGGNLFRESVASGPPQVGNPGEEGVGTLRQGALEASNVSTVQELVDMIETQRAYEINAKVIEAADEMMRYVNQSV
ncbi:MAG: flagellar basal-body rod protein FlgG [Sphingomonadaceae bacterium]|uniref:flagellar basal-body rod protein FlgG n=1 Tax=Thermaurantiacus sp. TaxID=2820283 RepID=UPI00298ED1A5|nr:flagellar basal-body rod protein FlgG [Thermaurantiacus sp.]MCS6985895.1 flagellar basal-body rod protein FlgG [Sphingomonadaceae bacterium]MDW8414889.1 flagellar basal-body rod protein FlgG [Thermaurantiacus sp.]